MKATLNCLLATILGVAFVSSSNAQDPDLLKLLGDKPQKEYVDYAFKSSRVIMSQSMEMIKPGVMDFN